MLFYVILLYVITECSGREARELAKTKKQRDELLAEAPGRRRGR